MRQKVLFVVNGLGLGNSTRCYAIIEHLHRAGVEIHVLTSGNGLFFFEDKPAVTSLAAMDGFQYGRKAEKLSVFRTLAAVRRLYRLYKSKTRELNRALDRIRPDLVVIDSEYCILPVRRRRIPLLAINNSDVVVSEYLRRKDNPSSIRWQFWLVEFMDYLFHRTLCDLVLSPAILPASPRHRKFHRIGVIVRQGLLEGIRNPRKTGQRRSRRTPLIVFMLSGSSFSSTMDFSRCDIPCQIHVVGRGGKSHGVVRFLGRVKNNISSLLDADVLVINGGFVATSEAVLVNKPVLIMPIPNHAEQYINARLLSEARDALIVDEETVFGTLEELVVQGVAARLDYDHVSVNPNGASEASYAILSWLTGRK